MLTLALLPRRGPRPLLARAAAVARRSRAALPSGVTLAVAAACWPLRLLPALDAELADMEEHGPGGPPPRPAPGR